MDRSRRPTKALTFLGTSPYETVTYVWSDGGGKSQVTTHLFPEAMARIFRPKKLVVFLTKEAETYKPPSGDQRPTRGQIPAELKEGKTHLECLRERLDGLGIPVERVRIPGGSSEEDLWEIFDKVASAVDEGDSILLDITHAFRSIPMLVLAVAAYIRGTKAVTVERIVYGAYEARDSSNCAPIFDLTLLLDLLDWLSGAKFMILRSDATLLAERLEMAQAQAWKGSLGEDLPRKLKKLAAKLRSFSQALHLARPRDLMHHANELLPLLKGDPSEAKQWARPLTSILNQLCTETEKFAHDDPDRLDKDNLCKQLTLVDHLMERELLMQAVTLAREWVVTWVAHQRQGCDWLDRKHREHIENLLGDATKRVRQCTVPSLQGESSPDTDEMRMWFEKHPKHQDVIQIWNELSNLRNNIAHCGMRKDHADLNRLQQNAKEILGRLRTLADDTPHEAIYGSRVIIDLKGLYGEVAKLDELSLYLDLVKQLAGEGNDVLLTGQAPIWLYLASAHALHGKARRLVYASPTTGEVPIFDHSAT